jgi:hypothetical protein
MSSCKSFGFVELQLWIFLATIVNMLEMLNFWNLVMCVFSLNFVALCGFLGMFKHVNTREEIFT